MSVLQGGHTLAIPVPREAVLDVPGRVMGIWVLSAASMESDAIVMRLAQLPSCPCRREERRSS